jgi:hypothetical protein
MEYSSVSLVFRAILWIVETAVNLAVTAGGGLD